MPNFFVPRGNIQGKAFFFDETESRHLAKVLRKKEGDSLQIFDGEGSLYPVRLTDCSDPKKVRGEILSSFEETNPRLSHLDSARSKISVTLYPAILKGPRFDWLLEKAVELGVLAIRPVFTERTLVKLDAKECLNKKDRWQKIALAAAKQCGRADLPSVDFPQKFETALDSAPKDGERWVLWEREKRTRLSSLAEDLAKSKKDVVVSLFTGPEGGFSEKEIKLAKVSGTTPVMIGPYVLRAETASMAAISRILF